MGTAIKSARNKPQGVGDQHYAMVSPVMIDAKNPLYSVNGCLHAISSTETYCDAHAPRKRSRKLLTASAAVVAGML